MFYNLYLFCALLIINGIVPRYSRKIMWLRVGTTNNDPKVILLYYLSATLSCDGIMPLVHVNTINVLFFKL